METQETPSRSFQIGDIYYTLFRHKWKIIICSLVGFVVAAAYIELRPPPFQSSTKLFIRYVITEGRGPMGPGKDDSQTKSPDQRGETIMSSELEILGSLDLAQEVAKNVGPEKILAKFGGGKSVNDAAAIIGKGLIIDVPRSSSVIHITFRHPDPDVAQTVLRELVASYLKKHVEIHRAVGIVGDFLTTETDQLRARLNQTEEELRKAMNKAGIVSLEDFKKNASEENARIRQQIFEAQAEYAERSSILAAYNKAHGTVTAPTTASTGPEATSDQIAEYRRVVTRLDTLHRREQELLTEFTEENVRVKEVRGQIAEAEANKAKLEKAQPALVKVTVPTTDSSRSGESSFDPQMEGNRLLALDAKIKALNGQLDQLKADAAKVDQLEVSILELRRRKDLEETNYKYFAANLEQSRINEALGSGRVSNISQIENPTPAYIDWKKPLQITAGIAVAGIAIGLAWAFAIEFFFDRSLRRPGDIEQKLQLPLFLSIPKIKTSSRKMKNVTAKNGAGSTLIGDALANKDATPNSTQLALLSESNALALDPFYETLRDRLISYFESVNLRHHPKLVAVTGLGRDSGVTTIAAGLAKSLSQTGEGNVLLVDMTQGQGSAQHFYKGNTSVNIDQLLDTRSDAQVDSNLYVVGESSNSEKLAKGMPQRFTQLVPKLKTSDFDYIIFDMPPVSQISITPRLASFMDMVLMVVESEKTDREIAQRATELLTKSKTHLGVVLNKTKSYVPNKLHQDKGFLLGT